jgi:hypothetical protein
MPPPLALLLLTACGDAEITLPPGGARPDVILISIDTLRADHVGLQPALPFVIRIG